MAHPSKAPSEAGNTVRTLRLKRNLTLRALAEQTGVPVTTIHSLESGRQQSMRLPHARKLAAVLRCALRDLVPELRTG